LCCIQNSVKKFSKNKIYLYFQKAKAAFLILTKIKNDNVVSPLQPPTLASVKTWGIQQELVATLPLQISQKKPKLPKINYL
jgi:hypothetical protein